MHQVALHKIHLSVFKRVGHMTHFYKGTIPMSDHLQVMLGHRISLFLCMQYELAREFPDYNKCLANNLSIDLLIINSNDPSMYTLSMLATTREVSNGIKTII